MPYATLDTLIAQSRAAWPTVRLPSSIFVAHLARHLGTGQDPATSLALVHGSDLYLACACAAGDENARRIFHEEYLFELPWMVAHLRLDEPALDELGRVVRRRLLVGEDGRPPRLYDYGGRTPLDIWVRIVVTRTAMSLVEQGSSQANRSTLRQLACSAGPPGPDA